MSELYQEYHGIALAPNSYIENFTVEPLAADPVPVTSGRAWFNTTEKVWKQSTLDAGGGVVVRTFATKEALDAAIAALDTRITAIEGAYVKKDGSVAFTGNVDVGSNRVVNVANPVAATDAANKGYVDGKVAALGSAFNYVATVAGGADSASAFDLNTLTQKDAGDYYKVATGGYFKVGAAGTPFRINAKDGLVFNLASGVDIIDNTNSEVSGTTGEVAVTGSTDTGFTVALDSAFKGRVSTLETGLAAEITRATGIETGLGGRLTAAESNIATNSSAIGNLATLTTDAVSSLVAAINEVDSHADAAKTAADSAQGEVDAIEAAVGLNTNGTLAAYTGTNYLNSVTTIKAATVALDTALKTEVDARASADTALDGRLTTVEGAVNGKIGDLTTLTTDAKGTLVGAINEVDAHADAAKTAADNAQADVDALDGKVGDLSTLTTTEKGTVVGAVNEVKALVGTGVAALKKAINDARFTYVSPTAQTSHEVVHGLNSMLVDACLWADRGDGVWRNDQLAMVITDANTITVSATAARKIRVTVEKMEDFA